MKTALAFFKKEFIESIRTWRLLILIIVFALLGIMNPAIAKLTPMLLKMFEESGLTMTGMTSDAMASWTQFFKNIPMGLIVFAVLCSDIFTKEYKSGTLILVLTKGLARYKVIMAKYCVMVTMWSLCYWLCYGITYGCNVYFWDSIPMDNIAFAAFNWWLFGMLTITIMVLFSVMFKNNIAVLIGTGGSVFAFYLIGMLPKIKEFSPSVLMSTASLLSGADVADLYQKGICTTVILIILCFGFSIPVMNKRAI